MDRHVCTLSAIYSIFVRGPVFVKCSYRALLQCVPFNSHSVSRVQLQRDFAEDRVWGRAAARTSLISLGRQRGWR